MANPKRTREPNPEAEARLLASKIVYLDLSGLLPTKARASARVIATLPARSVFKAGDWIEVPSRRSAALIERGSVDLVLPYASGGIPVKRLGPGAVFGDVPMLGLAVAGAKAVAAQDCQIVVIDDPSFREIIGKSAAIALRVIDVMGRELLQTEAERRGTVESRLFHLLEKLADEDGVVSEIGHWHLAGALGVTRQTVSEGLGGLRKQGLVETSRKWIKLVRDRGGAT